MEESIHVDYPILTEIKNGWAALADGWAVHGRTKEEAIQNYHEAEARHREIDRLPFWYERLPQGRHRRADDE